MQLLQWIAIAILALIPILAWAYIFLNRTNESRQLLVRTFFLGGLFTLPLLLYRISWNYFPDLNFISFITNKSDHLLLTIGPSIIVPVSAIFIFILVGLLEEILKATAVVKFVPKSEYQSVGDVVEYSIAAGLGFAFIENIFYIGEIYFLFGSFTLIPLFISRALFATFAHALFSGLFGYYYGIGVLRRNKQGQQISHEQRDIKFIRKLAGKYKFMNVNKIFKVEETFLGLIYASSLHAIYNIFLEINFTLFLIPFLVFGFTFLTDLLKSAKVNKNSA